MKQLTCQSATDFMAAVELEASRARIEEDQFMCVIVQGLLPNIRQFVVTREGNDANSLRRWFTVADAAAVPDPKEEISSVIKDIQKRLEEMRIHAAYQSNGQGRESPRSTSQSPTARRIQFSVPARSPSASGDESCRGRPGSAIRGWRDDGGVESRMSSRGRAKQHQMDYGRADTSFERDVRVCYVCHRAVITRVNVRRTHRGIVAVAAVT